MPGYPYRGPAPSDPGDIVPLAFADTRYARPVDRGVWATTTDYSVGDVVTFLDLAGRYICSTAHTSGAAFTAANWVPLAAGVPRVSVYKNTNTGVNHNADTVLSFSTVDYDQGSAVGQGVAGGILIRVAGVYRVSGTFIFADGNATGRRAVKLTVNATTAAGTFASQVNPGNSWDNIVTATASRRFAVGDQIRMIVTQDSGGSMTCPWTKWADVRPRLTAEWIGT